MDQIQDMGTGRLFPCHFSLRQREESGRRLHIDKPDFDRPGVFYLAFSPDCVKGCMTWDF
jgi:hypothetical protein